MALGRYALLSLSLLACNFLFLQAVYITTTDCDVSKGCLRPSCNCSQESCEYLVTYRARDDYIDFEVSTVIDASDTQPDTPYITMGINEGHTMHGIYTIGCYWNGTAALVRDGVTVTDPNGHVFFNVSNDGVTNIEADYNQTTLMLSCRFSRARDPGTNKYAKDLRGNLAYYLIASSGSALATDDNGNFVGFDYHDYGVWYLPSKISLSSNYSTGCDVPPASDVSLLLKIHGSLMLIAWMAVAAIGVLMALHYRITISNTKLLGSRTWLKLHRVLQITAVTLTAAGFAVVFFAVGGLDIDEGIGAAHPIIGIAIMSLALINGVGIFSRRLISMERAEMKQMMSTGHMIIGRLLFLLSAANIVLGMLYESMHLGYWCSYVIGGLVILTVLTELVLYIHARMVAKHNKELGNIEQQNLCNSAEDNEPKYISMKNHPCRIATLVLYSVVATGATGVVLCAIAGILPKTI